MTTTKVPSAKTDIQLQLADIALAERDEQNEALDWHLNREWDDMMHDEWILFGDDAIGA